MKKIFLGLTALALTFSAIAQEGKQGKKDKKEWKQEKFEKKGGGDEFKELNLTDEQKQQLKSANESFRTQMQDISKNTSLSQEDKKAKKQALLNERKERLSSILTPEQRTKFESLRKHKGERKHAHAEGIEKGKGDRKFNDFTKDLNLSADQSSKISTLNASIKSKIDAVKSNASLTDDQKKDQIKEIRKSQRTEISNVLTAEQKQQLKEKSKSRRGSRDVK